MKKKIKNLMKVKKQGRIGKQKNAIKAMLAGDVDIARGVAGVKMESEE